MPLSFELLTFTLTEEGEIGVTLGVAIFGGVGEGAGKGGLTGAGAGVETAGAACLTGGEDIAVLADGSSFAWGLAAKKADNPLAGAGLDWVAWTEAGGVEGTETLGA